MKELKLVDKISNPVDCFTYLVKGENIKIDAKIYVQQIDGSSEIVRWEVFGGILYITTPIWETNPNELKIFIEV